MEPRTGQAKGEVRTDLALCGTPSAHWFASAESMSVVAWPPYPSLRCLVSCADVGCMADVWALCSASVGASLVVLALPLAASLAMNSVCQLECADADEGTSPRLPELSLGGSRAIVLHTHRGHEQIVHIAAVVSASQWRCNSQTCSSASRVIRVLTLWCLQAGRSSGVCRSEGCTQVLRADLFSAQVRS